ncbi:hypothetical protein [Paracraurococcus lichenis]|uniref:Uncharacterized protein n=1 Tax=Paracraurococcus lichenis TaxID=3064888 RepID=A0ABT9E9U8_9PROT|nr:hypothetical protein [Paracraurococcus sp. LOR1-02]MDO9712748.1 hypothetical protein [Paracraurococcus sp. LOR1-02]
MAWIVRLVGVEADGTEHSTDVLHIPRPDTLADLASLGLTLAESKQLLAGVQQEIVAAQARLHAALRPECRTCGTPCRMKDYRQHEVATLFGQAWFRIGQFWVTRAHKERRPVRAGCRRLMCPVREATSLPRVKLAGAEAVPGRAG